MRDRQCRVRCQNNKITCVACRCVYIHKWYNDDDFPLDFLIFLLGQVLRTFEHLDGSE